MTTRNLLISFFLILGLLIPLITQDFVAENISASIAMVGCCFIIALLFWSKRVLFINILIAVYVSRRYLMRPFISIFEDELWDKDFGNIISFGSYYNPEAAAVVYWSLFSLLLAWLIGLLLLKSPQIGYITFAPKIFTRLDQVIQEGGLPILFVWGLLFVLNFEFPSEGLRGAITGEGSGMFLWGLASLSTINFVFLLSFLKRQHASLKPVHYYLLIPILITVLYATLSASRGSIYYFAILGLSYWVGLNIHKRWKPYILLKKLNLFLIIVIIGFFLALSAQSLKTLYFYSDSVDSVRILEIMNYRSIFLVKENLMFGITKILYRLSALEAQFYILNDWFIHDPWQYFNPVTSLMRSINDLVPGDIFPGMLTINQLYRYIYFDSFVHYASQMWSIQGTLYIYFGHILAPIIVFCIAVFTNRIYPSIERKLMASPAFAAFFMSLLLDIITNGTLERIITVDIVRPLASFVIFVILYKKLSPFFPTRIRLSKRGV